MHLILTGATGLVGTATLNMMLRSPAVTHISVFARSPVPQAAATDAAKQKCTLYTHADFAQPPPSDVLAALRDARGCVWALGISVNDVDKAAYRAVTHDYALAWARAFRDAGLGGAPRLFNFVYVSGEGATMAPGALTPRFARVKGDAERALLDLAREDASAGFNVYAPRPGAVDEVAHPEIAAFLPRKPEGLLKKGEKALRAGMRHTWSSLMSPTQPLGEALIALASGDGEPVAAGPGVSADGRVLQNSRLRKIAGLQ